MKVSTNVIFVLSFCAVLAGMLVSSPVPSSAQTAQPQLNFELVDADGLPVAQATIRISGEFDEDQVTTNEDGKATLAIANGDYDVTIEIAGSVIQQEKITANKNAKLQYQLPLHRFRVWVSASNGDLMEGAQAQYTDSAGKPVQVRVIDGQIDGVARAGKVDIQLTWNAQTLDLVTIQLPETREELIELPVVPLNIQVQQKDTGIGFGPALVAAASEGNAFPAGKWTEIDGKVNLYVVEGDVRVQASWFGTKVETIASAPGDTVISMPLQTRTIPGPLQNPPSSLYKVQIRQPAFRMWTTGTPRDGIQLPLPAGRYDITIFDKKNQPTHQGVATIKELSALAEIDWKIATSANSQLTDLLMVWPKGIWAQLPSVGIQDSGKWIDVAVAANGSLGLLPEGMRLRIPNHPLGKQYTTGAKPVDVDLGVIEIKLTTSGSVKIISADSPDHSYVQDCKPPACRIAVPSGKYLVYVPKAQLIHEPVAVTSGQEAFVFTKAL